MSVFGDGGGGGGGGGGGVEFCVIVFVTVTVTGVAAVPFTIVAGLPEIDGEPKVQPLGADGSDGSLTVHTVSVSNGPAIADAPAASATVCAAAAPHWYLIEKAPVNPDEFASNTLTILR